MPTNFSYPLSLPTSGNALASIEKMTMRAKTAVAQGVSMYTFQQWTQVYQGQAWEGELTLSRMDRATASLWLAFVLSLNGKEGTFIAGDPHNASPRGSAGGTPRVRTASQSGRTIDTIGWTASATVLLPYDGFSVGSTNGTTRRMHKALTAVTTNASGAAVIDIWPAQRESQASGALIYVNSVSCTWRLASNVAEWNLDIATIMGGLTLPIIEAL